MNSFTLAVSRTVRSLAYVAFIAVASGCASVQMASPEADKQAKQFSVPPGKSRIYVYRNETMGGAIKIPVMLDGKMMGSTAPKTYFAWDVTPGNHDIMCAGENNVSLRVNAPSGRAVYVWQEMKMGMMSARCALNLVDETTGRAGVMECGLAQSMQ